MNQQPPSTRWRGALAAAALAALPATSAAQDYYSDIRGYSSGTSGPEPTIFDLGGPGVARVHDEFLVSGTDLNGTGRSSTVKASADTHRQITGGYLSYSIIVGDVAVAGGPAAAVDNAMRQYFRIEPNKAYPDFAPINFAAMIDGEVSLTGRSGGGYVGFSATFFYVNESGNTFQRFEWALPEEFRNPPAVATIDEQLAATDNVKVGTDIRLEVNFSMDLNGSGHDRGDTATNTLDFQEGLRVSFTPAALGVGRISRASGLILNTGFEGPPIGPGSE